jgi:Ca-activated chloride channel family protein
MTRARPWTGVAGAALAAASGAALVAGQARQPVFRTQSEQVAVYATVRDRAGAIVRGLARSDFEVRDNGVVREVTTFSSDIQPITLAMVLDRSGSLAQQSSKVTAAALGFFDALLPGDRVSLGSLTWDCVGMSDDLSQLKRVVVAGMPLDSGSPIWDSLDRTFFSLASEPGRRAILMFSDGSNTAMPSPRNPRPQPSACRPSGAATGATRQEVAARAERTGVLIYAVGVENWEGRQDSDLRNLARDTGGDLFRMTDGESLTAVFERIAEELHHQYLLGFVPVGREGESRRIDVRVKRSGLTVRARRSYALAPAAARSTVIAGDDAPLSDAGVAAAIADGLSGKSLRASCLTPVTASGNYFEVSLEGPAGRIMSAAREARQRGESFTVNDVGSRLRSQTVRVIAAVRTVTPADAAVPVRDVDEAIRLPGPPAKPVRPPSAAAVRLRGIGARPVVIDPVLEVMSGGRQGTRTSEFDLAAFQGLGDTVEVIVYDVSLGESRCRLNRRALDQVR